MIWNCFEWENIKKSRGEKKKTRARRGNVRHTPWYPIGYSRKNPPHVRPYIDHTPENSAPHKIYPPKKVQTLVTLDTNPPPHHPTHVKNCSNRFRLQKHPLNGTSPKLPHTGPHTGKDPPKNPDTTSEYPTHHPTQNPQTKNDPPHTDHRQVTTSPKLPHTGPHTGKDPPKNPDTTSEYPTPMMLVESYRIWYECTWFGIGINIFGRKVQNMVWAFIFLVQWYTIWCKNTRFGVYVQD